jgi:hypothetical protein
LLASDNDQSAIEEVFSKSWDRLEQFYKSQDSLAWPYAPMLNFIAELRQRGYDRQLLSQGRPSVFMLSPTGISHHDAKLIIYLKQNTSMILHYHNGADIEIRTEVETAEFAPELEALLQRLLAHPID